ncbi:MAG: uroporphyrinogen decarboxylase family protein [Armatimonadota bacterium]
MNCRERVLRSIRFEGPDMIPVGYFATPAVLLALGQPLMDLLNDYPNDFFDNADVFKIPERDTANYRPDGSYCKRTVDEWGCEWVTYEEGQGGEMKNAPLDDWSKLKDFHCPPVPNSDPDARAKAKADMARIKERYIGWGSGGYFWERLQGLRGHENILIDIAEDAEELYILADRMLEEYTLPLIELALESGADVVGLADDWGAQNRLLISPEAWRRIFKPRYKRMIDLVHQGGALCWLHSCGMILDIIPDLIELGLDVINPQLGCNDNRKLRQLADHKLCIYSDLDRQHILPFGAPEDVRRHVQEATDLFAHPDGGFMYSVGIGYEVPLRNIAAMLAAFEEFRRI